MTNRAKALRSQINHLAIELAGCSTKAQARCIKQSIQAAEKQLTELEGWVAAAKRKKPSGPSGDHQQRSLMVRESVFGQFEEWKAAAKADGRTLSSWLRFHADNAVVRWKKKAEK
jgi:hypothetical protein